MCQFCSFGPSSNKKLNFDSTNPNFSDLFCPYATEAAIHKVSESRRRKKQSKEEGDRNVSAVQDSLGSFGISINGQDTDGDEEDGGDSDTDSDGT